MAPFLKLVNADSGLLEISVINPARSKANLKNVAMSWSSSTIRILVIIISMRDGRSA